MDVVYAFHTNDVRQIRSLVARVFAAPAKAKTTDIRELGIIEPDGDMTIALDLSKVPILNLADDPYAERIMSHFRSHLAN